jgi:hypothetical protein
LIDGNEVAFPNLILLALLFFGDRFKGRLSTEVEGCILEGGEIEATIAVLFSLVFFPDSYKRKPVR